MVVGIAGVDDDQRPEEAVPGVKKSKGGQCGQGWRAGRDKYAPQDLQP